MTTRQHYRAGIGAILAVAALVAWWCLRAEETRPVESGPRAARETEAVAPPIVADREASRAPLDRVEVTASLADLPIEPPRYLVTGSVVARAGDPVYRFSIALESTPNASSAVRLARAGGYSQRMPGPGAFELTCRADGYLTQKRSVTLLPEARQAQVDFELEPAISIGVRFMTPDGKDWKTELAAQQLQGGWFHEIEIFGSRTPPGGRLTAEEQRADLATMSSGQTRLRKPLRDLLEERMQLSRRDGEVARRPGPDQSAAGVVLDTTDLESVVDLEAPPPLFLSAVLGDSVLGTEVVVAGMSEVDIIIPPERIRECLGEIRLRAVDAITTRPIDPLRARAHLVGDSRSDTGRRSAHGAVTFDHQMAGRISVEVVANGYAPWQQVIDLAAGETRDLGTVALDAGTELRGEVIDPDGLPVSECWIALVPLDERGTSDGVIAWRRVRPVDRGSFVVPELSRARYTLLVRTDAWAIATATVDTTTGSPGPLRVVLARGSRVTLDLKRVRQTRSSVTVTDAADGSIVMFLPAAADQSPTADITTLVLAPGRYTLTVRDARGACRRTLPLLVTNSASEVVVLK